MSRHTIRAAVAAGLMIVGVESVAAQSLAQRVQQAPADRTVMFSYEARPGVCGDGRNIINVGDEDVQYVDLRNGERTIVTRNGRHTTRSGRCDFGPVRIELQREGGRIEKVRARVGAEDTPRDALDLGTVSPAEAVDYLLGHVVRSAPDKAAGNAVFASTIAAGVEPWPALLEIARDEELDRDVRKSAVFWVGQAAAERATEGLRSMVYSETDIDVRESAIFALSQRPRDEGVPILIDIVRTSPEPKLRKSAMFWLGQSGDPRAIALFEELLTGG